MNASPNQISRGLSPVVVGYSVFERCWEDAISITFKGVVTASDDPVLVRMTKMRRSRTNRASLLRKDYEIRGKINGNLILKPLYYAEADGVEYLVLRNNGTQPIAEILLQRRLSLAGALTVLVEIVGALEELHEYEIIHCGINPHSLWASDELLDVQITDFSRSMFRGETPSPHQLHPDLQYIAPEQTGRMDRLVDARADLYSIGAVAYYLLCGQPPFGEAAPLELVHAHLAQIPVPPETIDSQIPHVVSRIVMKLLSKAPEERYQTAAGLKVDLRKCLSQWQRQAHIQDFKIAEADFSSVFKVSKKLYGRDTELATLRGTLARVEAGCTELVLVSGAPGVGKSLLVQTIQSDAMSKGALVSGKFDQYKQNEPYSVIAQAFRHLIDQLLCGSEESLQRWRQRVIEALGANLTLIIGVIPEIQDLIGRQHAAQELPAAEKRHRFYHAFRQLIKVFANADHPLCLFLDDLQWADPASLALLQTILADGEISNFLVIGAFRPWDENGEDMVAQWVDDISRSPVPISHISLSQLDVNQISALLQDTLRCSGDDATSFAELVKTKTDGNPFFIGQFLTFLNYQKLIVFDFTRNRWTWELRRISAEGITDNVLQLMKRKLVHLPPLALEAIKVATCFGNSFAISALSFVMEKPSPLILTALRVAELEGLIIPVNDGGNEVEYKFLHDRIQQAAYSLVPEALRPGLRLQIGRRLLAQLPQAERHSAGFVILDNLNVATHLLDDRDERKYVAELNAKAGRRTREVAAFDAALDYFRKGIELLQDDGWTEHYQLTLELHLGRFECAYVVGKVEEANELFVALLEHSSGSLDKARAYYLKILLNTGMDRSEEAVAVGLEALKLFDEGIPERPSKLQLFRELASVILRLRGRSARQLLELPKMTDDLRKATATLLMSICPAAYFRNPDLMMLSALRIVGLSLQHGNAPASSFGYALYGLARGALFSDYKGGHEFGRLAVELSEIEADPTQQCKILTLFGGWLNFWREPIDSSVNLLTRSLKMALEAGDIQYAHYSALQIIFLRFTRGVNLDELMNDVVRHRPIIEQASDWFTRTTFSLRKQFILALQNRTRNWLSLDDEHFKEEPIVAEMQSAGNLTALTYYLIAKTQLAYLFGDFIEARRRSDEADAQIASVVNQIVVVEHYFYRGLVSAALIRQGSKDSKSHLHNIKKSVAKLARYAKNCPNNFEAHYLLLRAEMAFFKRKFESAAVWFDQAAALAREQRFYQIEALANELAGESCVGRNRDHIAKVYLLAALDAYQRWGASAKRTQIQVKYEALLDPHGADAVPPDRPQIPRSDDMVHFDSLMRAAIDLSEDLESDRLLNKLMRLILESMGAERAFIVSGQTGTLRIEAAASSDGAQVSLFNSAERDEGQYSESVVNYVLHTGRQVLLDDARADVRFQACPHIARNRARSIACIPLTKTGSVFGAAYVENAMISKAFVKERMRGLTLLAQQAFSAIQNIELQTQLGVKNTTLQAALQHVELLSGIRSHLAKFVPRSLERLIEENPENPDLAARDEDVSIMFLDIAGSTSMSEQFGSEALKRIIETYFSSFIDDIVANGGDINEVAGDGLMIIFQDRDSLEHAKLATRSALSIREKTEILNADSNGRWPPIVINIGIHSGSTIIGASKIESVAGTRWVYTATGYVANVAARIGAAASNGAILVSEVTAGRLGSEFDLVERGAQNFKGVSHPINLYSVNGRAVG
jgi:predicted ATPase/class 3 adenylate cyclase/GAF domain-containing protein